MALRISLVKGQSVLFDDRPATFLGRIKEGMLFDWEDGLICLKRNEKMEMFENVFMWFSSDERSNLSLFLEADPKINISRGEKP